MAHNEIAILDRLIVNFESINQSLEEEQDRPTRRLPREVVVRMLANNDRRLSELKATRACYVAQLAGRPPIAALASPLSN